MRAERTDGARLSLVEHDGPVFVGAPTEPPAESTAEAAPSASRRRAPIDLTPESLAQSLYSRRGELGSIARRHGLSLDELARRSALPEFSSGIASLRALAEERAAVLLARAKADATRLLLGLASGSGSDETRRKACVDLIKADTGVATAIREDAQEDDASSHGAAASLLAMLERLGDPAREMLAPTPGSDASREGGRVDG